MLVDNLADVMYNVALVPTKIGFGSVLCTQILFTLYSQMCKITLFDIAGNSGKSFLRSWKLFKLQVQIMHVLLCKVFYTSDVTKVTQCVCR